MQYSGANWHPHVYNYPAAKKRALARRKIFTKYRHVADVVHALEPAIVVPCAGPPCFLDDELFDLNFSEHSIFPGADDFYRFAESEGFAERVRVLMPGDELVPGRPRPGADRARTSTLPPYADKRAYLEAYRERRRPALQRPPRRHPRAGGPAAGAVHRLLPPARPRQPATLAERIGGGFLIETTGADAEQIFVDFGDRAAPVRRYAGEPLDLPPAQRASLPERDRRASPPVGGAAAQHEGGAEPRARRLQRAVDRVPPLRRRPPVRGVRGVREDEGRRRSVPARARRPRSSWCSGRALTQGGTCRRAGSRTTASSARCTGGGTRCSTARPHTRGYSISVTEESDEHAATA